MTEDEILLLIRKIVWKYYHPNSRYDFNDLVNEGYIAYKNAIKSYDPKKGAFSTWVFYNVRSAVLDFIKSFRNFNSIDDFSFPSYETNDFNVNDFLSSLSEESKKICQFIFKNDEIFNDDKPRKNRGILYKKLREQGWKWKSIWSSFNELKAVLN